MGRMERLKRLDACTKYSPLAAGDPDGGGRARYTDWTQLSIVSKQSLAWLNAQDGVEAHMRNDRFRMNIVVDAAKPFAEDTWRSFSIGEVACRFLKQCGRCAVTTADPQT